MEAQPTTHRVIHVRRLDERTCVLRFERNGLRYEPGQYVSLGLRGRLAMREYSIYSGRNDDYLEVLIRVVPGGLVSRDLGACAPGDELALEGPSGLFVTTPEERVRDTWLFVGTGTGIAPFHCLVKSYPTLDYRLLHGIRDEHEVYEYAPFDPTRVLRCTSRSPGGDYAGRVTDWLRANTLPPHAVCCLCGNSDMIYEVFGILREKGVSRDCIRAEIYF